LLSLSLSLFLSRLSSLVYLEEVDREHLDRDDSRRCTR
jgi:hypothetical protein